MNNRVLLIGSSGMLGSEIYKKIESLCSVIPTSFNNSYKNSLYMDIRDFKNVRKIVIEYNPDTIINCAAYTNVDKCESNKLLARDINVVGMKNIIKASKKNTKIIQISSDYVFDGKKGSYSEDDMTYPINYYGKTKLEAENILIGSGLPYVIFRPNVLYGDSFQYCNFLTWVVKSLRENKKISVVSDQKSNPTYIRELVNAIFTSIIVDFRGLLHIGSKDVISRLDFANIISDVFKLNSELISEASTDILNQQAARPLKSNLEIDKIQEVLNIDLAGTDYYVNKVYEHRC